MTCEYHDQVMKELQEFNKCVDKLTDSIDKLEGSVTILQQTTISQEKFYDKLEGITETQNALDKRLYLIVGGLLIVSWYLGMNWPF